MNRIKAREQAFLIIFEKTFNDEPIPLIIESAKIARDFVDDDFISELANGVFDNIDTIDDIISRNCIGWKKERISRVSLSLMRLSTYEILHEKDIPTSVSINEAVELAKKFAGTEDASYINGVLGSISKEIENKEPEIIAE